MVAVTTPSTMAHGSTPPAIAAPGFLSRLSGCPGRSSEYQRRITRCRRVMPKRWRVLLRHRVRRPRRAGVPRAKQRRGAAREDPEMTARLYRLWALSVGLALMLQFVSSWALTLLVP